MKPTPEEKLLFQTFQGKFVKIYNSVEDYQKDFPGPFPEEPKPEKKFNVFELL